MLVIYENHMGYGIPVARMTQSDGVKNKWWIMLAMGGTGGLILLDETIIGVALPTIRDDLGMSQTSAHWVVNAYMLAFACFAAAGGKLADIVGLKRMIIAGTALFGLASLASGFAQDAIWLIAARAVQGLGAAVIFPVSMAIVSAAFPKSQRGMALGVCASVGTAFLTAGPLVGGVLTDILSWRWIFWINIPVTVFIISVVWAIWTDPEADAKRQSLDFGGLITLVPGLCLLVAFLMQGGDWGWTSVASAVALGVSLLFLLAFIVIESRRESPLIEIDLFRNPTFAASSVIMFTTQFAKISIVVFGALYLQDVLDMSPLIAGVAMLAAVLGTPVMAAPAGRIADKIGPRMPALVGLVAATVSVAWIGAFAAMDNYVWLVPGLVIFGAAMPVCYLPALRVVMTSVPPEKQGQAGGIVMTVRLVGGTISIAVGGGLVSATGSYQIAFLTTAALLLAVTIVGWFAIEHRTEKQAA